MRVAVIGAGVSGLAVAHSLSSVQNQSEPIEVTVFEANDYAGGHTDTHNLHVDGQEVHVDTGFIVFNEPNYPNFTGLLKSLDVSWQDTDMSFSAVNERTGMEYGAEGFKRLFAQRRNLVSPSFYRMLWDLLRFYREAPAVLNTQNQNQTLGDYLKAQRYSRVFIENHILPMASALWSAPAKTIEAFPLQYFVSFMHNHQMLQVDGRPQWKTIVGGSNQYVKKLLQHFSGELRLSCPVKSVARNKNGVCISTGEFGTQTYDRVVFACHSDQALSLLQDPSANEQAVLGSIAYQKNQVVLHKDIRYLPKNRNAWASWNARIPESGSSQCTVSYWMNLLQNLSCETPLIATLNPDSQGPMAIDQKDIFAERTYDHPIYTHATLQAQQRRNSISGINHTWYCGAYWGWGFHEDGVSSALDCAHQITRSGQIKQTGQTGQNGQIQQGRAHVAA